MAITTLSSCSKYIFLLGCTVCLEELIEQLSLLGALSHLGFYFFLSKQ